MRLHRLIAYSEEFVMHTRPTTLQVAHWTSFKEEQRLDWQKEYLKRLCEADQEIAHTCELIQIFTTMLRER